VESLTFFAQTRLVGLRKIETGETKEPVQNFVEGPAFAFCGVGNPEAFFSDLRRWGIASVGTMNFRDHHRYTKENAAQLTSSAHWAGAACFVTTEKDEQNLRGLDFGEWPIYVAVIALDVSPEDKFVGKIR